LLPALVLDSAGGAITATPKEAFTFTLAESATHAVT